MDQDQSITSQAKINQVWDQFWREQNNHNLHAIFKHRLFIEGVQVFEKYLPEGVEKILVTGAGSGRYALHFAKVRPRAEVTAIDIVPSSVAYIERVIKNLCLILGPN